MTQTADKKRILLVDDDPFLLGAAQRLLEENGYEVITHDRGFNVSNLLAKNRPDLVLMDVNMPFLSGDQLVKVFNKDPRLRVIPVVFLSSNDESSLREMVQETGARGYISKSDLSRNLIRQVKRFLESSAPAQ